MWERLNRNLTTTKPLASDEMEIFFLIIREGIAETSDQDMIYSEDLPRVLLLLYKCPSYRTMPGKGYL